jgi:hypothetical protein
MSMNATDKAPRALATFVATVDLPLPEPPAMPIMRGFDTAQMYCRAGIRERRCGVRDV